MNTRVLLVLVPLCASISILAVGCGDLYSDPAEQTSLEPPLPPFPGVVDAAATVPRDFVQPCDVSAPRETTSCTDLGSVCEYGGSPDMRCNTTLACLADTFGGSLWRARPSVLCPSYECPKADLASAIDGTPCTLPANEAGAATDADELVCPMNDGVCACSTGPDAAHAHERRWVCARPTAGCPTKRPLAGSSCSTIRTCDYGSCTFKRGLSMVCSSSFVWTTGSATCN